MDDMLTVSVGETMPPKTKPSAMENPGRMAFATRATTRAVTKTTGKAKLLMMRRSRQSSFHEAPKASS